MEHGVIWYRKGIKEKERQDLKTSTFYLEKEEFRPSYSVLLPGIANAPFILVKY